jgi:hypothetical protein
MKMTANYAQPIIDKLRKFELHDRNARVLSTLALLLGCHSNFFIELPDGKRPDVLRYDSIKKRLFIGDAKNTETPRNKNTQKRLFSYLLWLSAYVSKPGRHAIFAVCFRHASDLDGWIYTIQGLALVANISLSNIRSDQIDAETNLVWFSVSS